MRRLIWLTLFLPLLAGAALAPGDKAYISDRLYLGVYATPAGSDRVALLSSGDALDVVEIRGQYIHVRGGNGVDGWVRGSYLTAKVPASVSLPALEQENAQLKSELADVRSRIDSQNKTAGTPAHDDALVGAQAENTQLKNELAAAQDHISTLQAAAAGAAAKNAASPPVQQASVGFGGDNMLLVASGGLGLLLGFFWGRTWYRRRLEARFGGLHLR